MEELFDVFDDQSPGGKPQISKQKPRKDKSKKRLANGEAKEINGIVNGNEDVSMPEAGEHQTEAQPTREINGDSQPEAKRQRRDIEAEPLVTDTFETEQSTQSSRDTSTHMAFYTGSFPTGVDSID